MLQPVDEHVGFLSEKVFDQLSKRYAFDKIVPYPFINIGGSPILLNRRSETAKKVILKTVTNNVINFYFLKELPWYIEKDYIHQVVKLQSMLHEETKLAPKVIRTIDDQLFFEVESDLYYLQEYVSGKSCDNSLGQASRAGQTLAAFHTYTKDMPEEGLTVKEDDLISRPTGLLHLVIRNYKEKRRDLNLKHKDYMTLIQETRQKILQLKDKTTETSVKRQVVHGDFNPTNLIFVNQNEPLQLIDFDNISMDSTYHDLAEALVSFSIVKYKPNSSRFDSLHESKVRLAKALYHNYIEYSKINHNHTILDNYIESTIIEYICLGVLRGDFSINEAINYIRNIDNFTININDD